MRTPRTWLAGLVFLLAAALCEAADGTITAILADPAGHDGRAVTLSGTVSQLDPRVSRRGNAYYTFKLDDGSARITIYSSGQPSCPAGSRVTVDGEFRHVKKVSGYTFHDQVDARRVTCR